MQQQKEIRVAMQRPSAPPPPSGISELPTDQSWPDWLMLKQHEPDRNYRPIAGQAAEATLDYQPPQ